VSTLTAIEPQRAQFRRKCFVGRESDSPHAAYRDALSIGEYCLSHTKQRYALIAIPKCNNLIIVSPEESSKTGGKP
jgi:hypothetical protein